MKTYSPEHGEFSFAMNITKSELNGEGKMVIKGVASNTNVDKQDQRFTRVGLETIKSAIEEGLIDEDGDWNYVPLRSGHGDEWNDILGWITKAEIDSEENLWVTAELDEDSPTAVSLYKKISKGNREGRKSKLGLSVRGKTTKFGVEFDPVLQRRITALHNLLVKEVSVTGQPANPTPYSLAIAKSLIADPVYQHAMEEPMDNETTTLEVVKNDDVNAQVTTAESEALDEAAATAADEVVERVDEVPAGYVALPTQSTEQEAPTQEVATTEPVADPVAVLESKVDAIQSVLSELATAVAALRPQEVQKSTEVETPAAPDVEVVDLDARIATAVSSALAGFKDDLNVVKSQLITLSEQPIDKSIAVIKSKDEDNPDDPFERMKTLKSNGNDPIAAALKAAYNK